VTRTCKSSGHERLRRALTESLRDVAYLKPVGPFLKYASTSIVEKLRRIK